MFSGFLYLLERQEDSESGERETEGNDARSKGPRSESNPGRPLRCAAEPYVRRSDQYTTSARSGTACCVGVVSSVLEGLSSVSEVEVGILDRYPTESLTATWHHSVQYG